MEMVELTIQKRDGTGKGAAGRLRRAGHVPAVLYGVGTPESIAVSPRDVLRLIHGHEGSTRLLKVAFPGSSESKMAIIRDMQFDPVSENLIHVDLQEVAMDRPIQVSVAVHHVGEPVGVRENQGILEMILREVQVSCLPANIPDVLEADVSGLHINEALTVKDLVAPEGVRILNDPNQAVVMVAPPIAEEAAVPGAPTAVAGPEPEVLTERKPREAAPEGEKAGDKKK
jgi:large subunit ribosomal protein L25